MFKYNLSGRVGAVKYDRFIRENGEFRFFVRFATGFVRVPELCMDFSLPEGESPHVIHKRSDGRCAVLCESGNSFLLNYTEETILDRQFDSIHPRHERVFVSNGCQRLCLPGTNEWTVGFHSWDFVLDPVTNQDRLEESGELESPEEIEERLSDSLPERPKKLRLVEASLPAFC